MSSFTFSTLRLFKSVLRSDTTTEAVVLEQYGYIVAPSAAHELVSIKQYLQSNKVTATQANQTFYASAEEVRSKNLIERVTDQLMHYFSTYGLDLLGIHTEFMYVPNNWAELNLPERIKFEVITGVDKQTFIEACLRLLRSGVALTQETIEDIFVVLDGCGYKFTGAEEINNKEARVWMYDRYGSTPNNPEELFRYFIYKATGKTLLVKDKETFEALRESSYKIPTLSPTQLRGLAESFNRRKPYWLELKKASDSNRAVVNAISRLSKSAHVPLKEDVLNTLTSRLQSGAGVDLEEVRRALSSVSLFRVVRAANALAQYEDLVLYRAYTVRNGRLFIKPNFKGKLSVPTELRDLLADHIRSKVDRQRKVYIPTGISYAFPTSEKQFVGEVPNFSTVEVDARNKNLLVGVYWEGETDYDLSCLAMDGAKVGWNSHWTNSELTYSGDITRGYSGAAEWMVVSQLSSSWQITVNKYAGDTVPFHIMVGWGPANRRDCRNYFIDPNDLLLDAKVIPTGRQTVLGIVSPGEKNSNAVRFTLLNAGNGNRHVSIGNSSVGVISATLPRSEATLKINDFLNLVSDPSEADVNLSPTKLTKTSLLDLLNV